MSVIWRNIHVYPHTPSHPAAQAPGGYPQPRRRLNLPTVPGEIPESKDLRVRSGREGGRSSQKSERRAASFSANADVWVHPDARAAA